MQSLLATIFFISGVAKLASNYSFHETLIEIGFKENTFTKCVAWIFPLIEIASAGLVLSEKTRLIGEIMIFAMLTSFIMISIMVLRSKNEKKIDCHCFGHLVEESLGTPTLIRSCVLALCVITLSLHREATGLFQLPAMEMASLFLCSIGIVALYTLLSAFWKRYQLIKRGELQ